MNRSIPLALATVLAALTLAACGPADDCPKKATPKPAVQAGLIDAKVKPKPKPAPHVHGTTPQKCDN